MVANQDRNSSGSIPAYVLPSEDWKAIDDALNRICKQKGELLYNEGLWLLAARDKKVHTHFGFSSFVDYVHNRLGHKPRTTLEKVRVAIRLFELPKLRGELKSGGRNWSVVRELSRVVTKDNETDWLDATRGMGATAVEEMVAGHNPGDDPKDPRLERRKVHLDMSPDTYALFAEALERARRSDPKFSNSEALHNILTSYLGQGADPGLAHHQVCLYKCEDCERTWMRGGSELVEVDAVVEEATSCDATHIGRVHGAQPDKAYNEIPPATRRQVLARDKGLCRVPNCRNTLFLDVHHIHPRAERGRHESSNLLAICATHQ